MIKLVSSYVDYDDCQERQSMLFDAVGARVRECKKKCRDVLLFTGLRWCNDKRVWFIGKSILRV